MSVDDTVKQGERISWSTSWSRASTFIVIPEVRLCLYLHRFLQIASPKVTDSFGKWLEKHPTAAPSLFLAPCCRLCSGAFQPETFLNQISWFEVSDIHRKYFLATMCYSCWQMEDICGCILPICWALPLASPLSPAGRDSGSWPQRRLQYGCFWSSDYTPKWGEFAPWGDQWSIMNLQRADICSWLHR